jgi:2-polyprenyl-3-methyl-5-hydroxy-6-metoxy-1,4-benzoquinol methylase
VLDIGPGHGKYATLLREYLNHPPQRIDAVEAHRPYITAHHLWALYDEVRGLNALDLDAEDLAPYDLVMMIDVIEHMDKAAALALLDRIRGWVIICTPEAFFATDPGLPATEEHVSHWTPEDFTVLPRLEHHSVYLGGHLVRLRPA